MVLLSSTQHGFVYRFDSPGVERNVLHVTSVNGRDAISSPYRWEIGLVSSRSDIESDPVLRQPAALRIKQSFRLAGSNQVGIRTIRIHGDVVSFQQRDDAKEGVGYRAVLVPRLWKLSLNVQSRIFMGKTVPEIVEEVLKTAGFTTDDYLFQTSARPYPQREYVVQYQESDLDFISRLMEHDGIFYSFRQEEERERVIFGDSPTSYAPVPGDPSVQYRPPRAGESTDWFQEGAVRGFAFHHNLIQNQVTLRDYNYRTPGADLMVSASTGSAGFGTLYEYGDHYKDTSEGKALAQIRAEEVRCREKLFQGRSDVRSLQAGCTFTLRDHPRAAFNQEYLLAELRHQGEQRIEIAGGSAVVTGAAYENKFTALPASVPFRPQRVTPRPRITGTLNAVVDAAGGGEFAEIDDQGRYKVRLPLDLSGKVGGTASRYVRKAQPYAGPGYGMHFPLHKGVEVALGFTGGDPDRPIILGAVPNPETESPVKGGNQTQCVLKSGGDNKIVIDDDVGRITIATPTKNTKIKLGAAASPEGVEVVTDADYFLHTGMSVSEVVGTFRSSHVQEDYELIVGGDRTLTVQGGETVRVGGNESVEVGGNQVITVGAMLTPEVMSGGDRRLQVLKDETVTVGGRRSTSIARDEETKIGGRQSLSVQADSSTQIVNGNLSLNVPAGCVRVDAREVVIQATEGIRLAVGDTFVAISRGGVNIEGPRIIATGREHVSIHAGGVGADVTSEGSVNIQANDDVKMNGELIKMNVDE